MSELAIYEQPSGNTALAVPDHHDIDSWVNVISDVIKIANVICDTPFVPDGLRGSGPATAAAILAGREMGLGMMTSLANIDIIKGKPTQKPLLMRGMILSQGHKWIDVEVTDTRAVVRGCRKGEHTWTEVIFTAAQAKTGGIDLGRYPADKLYARATSRLARRKFADVIMGMPYSPEDVEDGDDAEAGTIAETAASNGQPEPAKPAARTAQRRTRAAAERPTTAAPAAPTAPTTGPATATAAPSGDGLPPLPGEDEDPTQGPQAATASPPSGSATGEASERDYDSPGTVTTPQLTAIWTIFTNVYKFTADEKDHARAVAAHIIGHSLTSTRDMAKNEARSVLDTLSNWQAIASERGESPRDVLVAMMAAAEDSQAGTDA